MAETETPVQATGDQPAAAQAAAGETPEQLALKKQIEDLRKENAAHRTKLRDQETAQAAAEQAALTEQGKFKELYEKEQLARTALETKVSQAERQQAQLAAATAAGLPATMAARLVGATVEELAADAKALAEQLKVPPPTTGATNPATQRGASQSAAFDLKNPPTLHSYEWKK